VANGGDRVRAGHNRLMRAASAVPGGVPMEGEEGVVLIEPGSIGRNAGAKSISALV
jgi:hypothetical protein